MAFDPFGDHATRGYLRNFAAEADPERVRRLEHHSFAANVLPALRALEAAPRVGYAELLAMHNMSRTGMIAPWVLDGPMNGDAFITYVTRILVPELSPGKRRHHGQPVQP